MLVTDGPVAPLKRLTWRVAAVRRVIEETPRVRTIVLDVPDWPGHLAGQHVDMGLASSIR